MAISYQQAANLFQRTLTQVSSGESEWKSFLKSAARFYKYTFAEQIMIYAQKPEATACAEYAFWRDRMHRQVKRGSKGIALFDDRDDSLKLYYVFDVADTAGNPATLPYLWQLRKEHEAGVQKMLQETFSLGKEAEGLQRCMKEIAGQYAENLKDWTQAQRIFYQNSMIALVLLRCGKEPEEIFSNLDLSGIAEFSAEQLKRLLGTEISHAAKEILLKIGTEVRTQELAKKKSQEELAKVSQSRYNTLKRESETEERKRELQKGGEDDGDDLSQRRGRTIAEHRDSRTGGRHREIREDAETLPERTPDVRVLRPDHGYEAERTSDGNQRSGTRADGRAGRTAEEAAGRNGSPEGQRPDGMGTTHEQHPQPGGGNRPERNRIPVEQRPAEAEERKPSAFSLPQNLQVDVLDTILRTGSNREKGLQRLVFCMMRDCSMEEQLAFFKEEYRGGKGLVIEGNPYAVLFEPDGMRIAKGDTVRVPDAAHISWENIGVRIRELLQQGIYVPQEILEDAVPNAVSEAAKELIYMAEELEATVKSSLRKSELFFFPQGGHPVWEEVVQLALFNPEDRKDLLEDLETLTKAYAEDPEILRFHHHPPDQALSHIRRLEGPFTFYPVKEGFTLQEPETVITQDEVDAYLMRGGAYSEGKLRIYSEFLRHPIVSERAEILKKQYGTGGQSNALHADDSWAEYSPTKGLTLSRKHFTAKKVDVRIPWNTVAKRIGELMEAGRFLTERDRLRMPEYERIQIARQIRMFYSPLPMSVERPYSDVGDWLNGERTLTKKLEDPEQAQKLLAKMEAAFSQLSGEEKGYREAEEGLNIVRQYLAGTYTIFPELETEPKKEEPEQISLFTLQAEQSSSGKGREVPQESEVRAEPVQEQGKEPDSDFARLIQNLAEYFSFAPEDVETVVRQGEAEPMLQNLEQAEDETAKTLLSQARKLIPEAFADENERHTVAVGSTKDFEDPKNRLEPTTEEREPTRLSEENPMLQKHYRLLSRLKSDCEYFLGAGGRAEKHLWAGNVREQIAKMQELYDSLSEKPEWLTLEDINRYAQRMAPDLEEELDRAPISVPTEEGWKTYPNAGAAEEALAKSSGEETKNFRLQETLEAGGPKVRFSKNIEAIRLLKDLESEHRSATKTEQEILSRYVGWGGLSEAFDPKKENWRVEYGELKELLTAEEYESARASTLNAHYTDPAIIRGMYEVLERMGFSKGNLLEPALGIGNFFGALPDSMEQVNLYGVELDSLSGRIAQHLYPQADIQVTGYEKTAFPDQSFDVAIGNVPFGQYKVADRRYWKQNFQIHDYFFAKSLDLVRPGGVIAFITSRYTLDKTNSAVRKYLAERAEFLGAVRLPNTAFRANAGTSVTSDILLLQKRERPILPETEPEWIFTGKTEDGMTVNEYFLQHPEMVIGELKTVSGPYGPELTCAPKEGQPLEVQLRNALSHLAVDGILRQQEIEPIRQDMEPENEPAKTLPADPQVADYSYAERNGKLYFREHTDMTLCELPDTTEKRIRGMIAIRDQVRKVLDLQLMDAPDFEIREAQQKLEADYDRFTKQYGLLSSVGNRRAFKEDASYPLLTSLEELDEEGNLLKKADLFYKRTVRMPKPVTHTDTASEALAVSLSERAEVDLAFMSELCGKNKEEILQELSGVLFQLPGEDRFVTADEYLSGNVREKLAQAEEAAERDVRYQANVEALRQALPKPLSAAEIEVHLGATWVEASDIQQFMEELLQPPGWAMANRDWGVLYIPQTGVWHVGGKTLDSGVTASVTYGTKRASAYRLLEDALNLKTTEIFDVVYKDGKEKRVLNSKETVMAGQKQDRIKEAFREWIFKDPERRERLCRKYNEIFNSHVAREYNGEHLTFPGMNPEIALRPHQKNAVARILYGGNTLLAHVVGAGKTFTMAAAAMESKRIGLCSKSLFVVPNHLVEQWSAEFLRLYPTANLLAASKQDFTPANRKRFCSRIATGDYDAVIIGHSQFQKIPLSREYQENFLNEQLQSILTEIELAKANRGEAFTVKQMERQKKSLETQLLKLSQNGDKDQGVVTFEQLGADRIFVDEAHGYKNLMLQTKMRNVAGIGTAASQKASDLFAKCRYLDEKTEGKGIIFATGTPVSNSMSELYIMQLYLQYTLLKEIGMLQFDSWAATFGEIMTTMELAPEGSGYRPKTRFAKFHNLPELITFFKEAADIQTADLLNLPVPKAEYHDVVLSPSELQKQMVKELGKRAEAVRKGNVDPTQDNMLRITTDGRKLALDERLIDESLAGENSKAQRCAENALQIWKETEAQKSTQIIFCDLSTPKKDGFDVYTELKKHLMKGGVPEKEIAFIHDAGTDAKKAELFAKVRRGNVRFLLGSTAKMGAGTNVQDRLIALYHLDVPWKPSDIEQQEGRILRQGNRNETVQIYRYVTEGTFDAYSWQLIENKQRFISQIMTSKSPVRSCADIDDATLSYAEVKALAAGNPEIKEKMELDVEVSRLKLLKANHQSQKYDLEDAIYKRYPAQLASLKEKETQVTKDLETYESRQEQSSGESFQIELGGTVYREKETAGTKLLSICKELRKKGEQELTAVGSFCGFTLLVKSKSLFSEQYVAELSGKGSYEVELGDDALGNLTRLKNGLERLPQRMQEVRDLREQVLQNLESAKVEVTKPFAQEAELSQKEKRLDVLSKRLNRDSKTDLEKESSSTKEEAGYVPLLEKKAAERVHEEKRMERIQ